MMIRPLRVTAVHTVFGTQQLNIMIAGLLLGAASHLLSNLGGLPELRKLLVGLAVAPAQLLQLRLQRVPLVAHSTQLLFHCPAACLAPADRTASTGQRKFLDPISF